jgi:hypothetical protein
MVSTADDSVERPSALILPLALSLLMHGVLVALFLTSWRAPVDESNPFEVQVLAPEESAPPAQATAPKQAAPEAAAPAPQEEAIPPPKHQIVAPPDSPEETPDQARLFSDRDSKTLQETVKKGEPAPPAKPPEAKPRPEVAKKAAEQKLAMKAKGDTAGQAKGTADQKTEPLKTSPSTNTAPMVGLSDLFFKPSEVARDPALRKGEGGDDAQTDAGSKRDLASLSRPELWADPGQRGTPDYLPDIRQGDFTLLNTKADRFAPFVRRVGLRVFQSFSMEFKQQIYQGNVPQGRDNVEVEAVMSPDGKRLDVYLKQRNGNLSSDRVLLGSLNDHIFFDQNPPPKAVAEDGRIHFVFALNAQVWYARDENGRVSPGAHWVVGVGLL